MTPFIIYALPRSRTAWLAKFLSYGPWTCHHDIAIDMHSVDKLKDFFSRPYVGTAETGMIDGWNLVDKFFPKMRTVIVRRPLKEVSNSLLRFGICADNDLERRNKKLDEASSNLSAMVVDFDDLNHESVCKKVFEYCLGTNFDRNWWLSLRNHNIQVDMPSRLAKLSENRVNIEKLKSEVSLLMGVS